MKSFSKDILYLTLVIPVINYTRYHRLNTKKIYIECGHMQCTHHLKNVLSYISLASFGSCVVVIYTHKYSTRRLSLHTKQMTAIIKKRNHTKISLLLNRKRIRKRKLKRKKKMKEKTTEKVCRVKHMLGKCIFNIINHMLRHTILRETL